MSRLFFRIILVIVFAILWSALAASLLAAHGWLFDLIANLRVQIAAGLLLAALFSLATRQKILCVIALFGATLSSAAPIHHGYFGRPATSAISDTRLRVLQFNAWFRNADLDTTARYLESSDIDVVVIEEWNIEMLQALALKLPSYPYRSFDAARSRHGAGIFSRLPLEAASKVALSSEADAAVAKLIWQQRQITIVGVHLHWPIGRAAAALRDTEMAELAKLARGHDEPLIVVGDFNATPWSASFERLVADSGLADCARGRGLLPTWPSQFWPAGLSIDHCLASSAWSVIDVRRIHSLGSDHYPVRYELRMSGKGRGG